MGGECMKWKLASLIIILLLSLSSGCQNDKLSQRIVETIDNKCDQGNGYCNVPIAEITDFKWDKMAIFGVGSSNKEVSEALGVEYEDSTDLMTGIVFAYNNKIVYKEDIPYNPERPSKLWITIEYVPGEPACMSYTPDNAVLIGTKKKGDNRFYYGLVANRKQGK